MDQLSDLGHCSGPRGPDGGPEGWSFGLILCHCECWECPEVTVIFGWRVLGCWNERCQPCDPQQENHWG